MSWGALQGTTKTSGCICSLDWDGSPASWLASPQAHTQGTRIGPLIIPALLATQHPCANVCTPRFSLASSPAPFVASVRATARRFDAGRCVPRTCASASA
eukprot:scaffold4948_cov12-Tisochrysis_lutea.AAC.1